jgi:putative peptide maturation dehydrogenase
VPRKVDVSPARGQMARALVGRHDHVTSDARISVRIRRCQTVLIEPRERFNFDVEFLLEGGSGLRPQRDWIALAPHLDEPVVLTMDQISLLGLVSTQNWVELDELAKQSDVAVIHALLDAGLLLSDALEHTTMREREQSFRDGHWHPQAAVMHAFGRWHGVTSGEQVRNVGIVSFSDLVHELGDPPPHFHPRAISGQRLPLTPPEATSLDDLLKRRTTCRNYDTSRQVPFATFSHILHRVFGAQAVHTVTNDVAILKKTSPSAGGLHPTGAYLLIQHVERIEPGLYHYHAGDHALEPIRSMRPDEAHALATKILAHQDWFANAHVIVIYTPHFLRSFWKYRNHAKVYRAVTLDVGHLSQTLQISATEFGLGAFVTAAINEVDVEHALDLNPMRESPLAIGGFGWRAAECARMEFDPQHAVWPAKKS